MTSQRVLVIERSGPLREALVRVLVAEGHEVGEAEAGELEERMTRFRPDVVVGDESCAPRAGGLARFVRIAKPVNMEELRRALREGNR
ncbi:MAG: hypothetical protein JSU87_17725 [Gemmatimonadota bacterium]|nr:MAG: hypothetical protein JSU87_17725 [Gemmatimonadota bacterium]